MSEGIMTEAEARAIVAREEKTRKKMSESQRRRREKVKQARALLGEVGQ